MLDRSGQSPRRHDAAVMPAPRLGRFARALAALSVVASLGLFSARDADACGACYAQSSESTIVTDHRLAMSVTQDRTVLWDQIAYQGNPSEFAYVVPARPGTYLEPANESFFTALDVSTRPIIMQPQQSYGGYGGGSGGLGCACGAASSESTAFADKGSAPPAVQIVNQAVVGPYETVTLRSTDAGALETWLTQNGYAIPSASGPIIADYVAAKFDFIALRLRPGASVRQMQPIRIVAPGADPNLPLRMMSIGAGANLPVTFWVIGEGRYRAANFPNVKVDFEKLIWDFNQNRSNYQELSKAAMAAENGRGILTEYAGRPTIARTGQSAPQAGMTQNVGLGDAYAAACAQEGIRVVDAASAPSFLDSGADPDASSDPDAGNDPDAGDPDAGAEPDAGDPFRQDAGQNGGRDAGPVDSAVCDDLARALHGMSARDVWVTRLRASFPVQQLDGTLRLEADPTQAPVDNIHTARDIGTITQSRVSRTAPENRYGIYVTVAATAFIVSRMMRRRRGR